MFLNAYNHSLDAKGRVAIPKEFRRVLATQSEESLILSISAVTAAPCVVAYPTAAFRAMAEQIVTDGPMDPELQRYARVFFASSVSVPIDGHGRVLIPARLREVAEIGKEITWVGMWKQMEIWPRERWEEAHARDIAERDHLQDVMTKLSMKTGK